VNPPGDLATALVAAVGGPGNIAAVEHCVTRLRFVLRDPQLAEPGYIEAMPGIVSVMQRAGQLQVVVGTEVADAFDAIEAIPGIGADDAPRGNQGRGSLVGRGLDLLTGTFQPLLWALVGASLIQTALAILVEVGWLSTEGTAYAVWAAAGSAPFVFLPVLVGISAARKLGANPFVGGAIGAALLEAHFVGLGPIGTHVRLLGLPLTVVDYSQSVFPALLAAVMLAMLERWLRRKLPSFLHMIVIPAVCLAVLVPLTMVLFGPIGSTVSSALSAAVEWIWELSPFLAGAIMGGLWQVFVMFGVHWGFVPVILNDLTVQGHSLLTGPLVSAVLAQGAAAAAVALRTGNRELRSLAGAATVSAMVAGITEPAIYGVTLRLRRPFVYACIAGAVGGSVAALGRSAADTFIFPALLTLPAYMHIGSFGMQLAGTGLAIALAFGLTWFLGFTDLPAAEPAASATAQTPQPTRTALPASGPPRPPHEVGVLHVAPAPAPAWGADAQAEDIEPGLLVRAPMAGEILPLDEVSDPVFARGLLGPGVAIRPADGWVRSPVSGTVTSVSRSRHAIGVTSEAGADVLVHVGLDTVLLGGAGFEVAVATGDPVVAGQVLMHVDLETLGKRGADLASPVVVTNAAAFAGVHVLAGDAPVGAGDPLLRLTPNPEPDIG
jgi:PTS system beta-glucosides-specific IIC component